MKIEDVPINKIVVGDRYRSAQGDIGALAENIREVGLLQPIGVDSKYRLIFGSRRLEAYTDVLRRKTIPCVVLKLKSMLAGEYSENEFRKQFTPSERADIGEALEAELLAKERRGGDHKSKSAIADIDPAKNRSVDIAAKKAGFKSAETYERAKTVVEHGIPELVQAMDSGEISISASAEIATLPKAEQQKIVAMPKAERKAEVSNKRKQRPAQKTNEVYEQDLRVYRALHDNVEAIARYTENPRDTWAGLTRVSAHTFSDNLPRAIQCLVRLEKEHPNEPWKPEIVKNRR